MSIDDIRNSQEYKNEVAKLLASQDFGVRADAKAALKVASKIFKNSVYLIAGLSLVCFLAYYVAHQYQEYNWRSSHCGDHLISWDKVEADKGYQSLDDEGKQVVIDRYADRVEQCKFKWVE